MCKPGMVGPQWMTEWAVEYIIKIKSMSGLHPLVQ